MFSCRVVSVLNASAGTTRLHSVSICSMWIAANHPHTYTTKDATTGPVPEIVPIAFIDTCATTREYAGND